MLSWKNINPILLSNVHKNSIRKILRWPDGLLAQQTSNDWTIDLKLNLSILYWKLDNVIKSLVLSYNDTITPTKGKLF